MGNLVGLLALLLLGLFLALRFAKIYSTITRMKQERDPDLDTYVMSIVISFALGALTILAFWAAYDVWYVKALP